MALLIHTSHSVAQSGVRSISVGRFVLCVVLLAIVLFLAAFGLGWVFGQYYGGSTAPSVLVKADSVQERFTFDRLGDVSGRLLTLESEARTLLKKLTALETLESRLIEIKSGKKQSLVSGVPQSSGPAGGRVLSAEPCQVESASVSNHSRIAEAEKTLSCLQDILRKVEAAAASRSVNYMVLPTQQPLQDLKLGSRFGNRIDPFSGRVAFHSGLDFEAQTGTPIHAAGAGRVKSAGWASELGFVVEIEHGNGLLTRYAHASKLHVKAGDLVTPGQLIADVGSTGRSTGPHLHFEILHDGKFVDPMYYLNIGSLVPDV